MNVGEGEWRNVEDEWKLPGALSVSHKSVISDWLPHGVSVLKVWQWSAMSCGQLTYSGM